MRTKNKITREQHRVKKAQKQESKVLYFAQDPWELGTILFLVYVMPELVLKFLKLKSSVELEWAEN